MEYRLATFNDLDLLAEWNYRLIRDEGHRNAMTVLELRERMQDRLSGEYNAMIFVGGSLKAGAILNLPMQCRQKNSAIKIIFLLTAFLRDDNP
ncbi:MAG: hypothetical protein AB1585_15145 [Thermodesulfobacteriota bacterium]